MPVRVAARQAALALVLAMLAALVLAGPASAHAELASISPANGERLDAAPPDVVFTFTESVNLVDDGLRLVDEVGADVPTPEPTVDGATVMTFQFELLAFGAKIGRREGSPQVPAARVAEPVEGDRPLVVHPTQLGGTRHQSAAQFVHDQHDALALVASVDGRFTIFAWSEPDQIVSAYRVEALLL